MVTNIDPKFARIAEEYDLGELLSASLASEGNAAGYKLQTSKGSFFAKAESSDPSMLRLYHAVETALNKQGVGQARLLATKNGSFLSTDGFSLYEWLPGSTTRELSDTQFVSHIAYLAQYNKALATVPLDDSTIGIEALTACSNPWRKAASLDYLLGPFREGLDRIPLSSETRETAEETLKALAELRPSHHKLPKQMVHSDVGPGNILFEGDETVAIIDFTPVYDSHLYSLCVTFFWHCVFPNPGDLPIERIKNGLNLYNREHGLTEIEKECFFGLLVKAVAFRLFSRLIVNREGGSFTTQSIEHMALCMRSVLDARSELEKASV